MSSPQSFSWIERPLLSASAFPYETDDLAWLREQGIDILLTLTEDPVPKREIDIVGLMTVHVPIPDMGTPSFEQIEECLSVIERARESKMGVNVHCMYGKGRTGTILGAYLISRGNSATVAIEKVRKLRPGSIETYRQEEVLRDFARLRGSN